MKKYDEFLKSIIALGVRFGQENTNKNVEDVTDSAFKALMIAFKGKNPIGELNIMTEMLQKTENLANENSQDLTEKWKKGELPNGWYWVNGIRAEGIYAYTAEYLNNMYRPRNGERIIEQVPSYEEWQKHRKTLLKTQENNQALRR